MRSTPVHSFIITFELDGAVCLIHVILPETDINHCRLYAGVVEDTVKQYQCLRFVLGSIVDVPTEGFTESMGTERFYRKLVFDTEPIIT